MMKTTMKFLTYCMMAFTLVFTSCDGEDGMDGAEGPQGEQGIAGEDGNANVVSILVNTYDVVIGQNEILVPELTQDIYDNGLVYGYATVNGNAFWETLPIIVSQNVRLDIDRIEVGKIILTADFAQTLDFRFILIQGTDVNAKDFQNFEQLQSFYNLD